MFDRLFVTESSADRQVILKRYAVSKFVLDSVHGDAKSLRVKLGQSDQKKLDQYLSSTRETEQRALQLEDWMEAPKPEVPKDDLSLSMHSRNAHDGPMWIDVMLELSYLSLLTDTTRVISFKWSSEAGGGGAAKITTDFLITVATRKC